MDPCDLRDTIAEFMPNVQAVTVKSRLTGDNQSLFDEFEVPRASQKKVDRELRLALDANLSKTMTTWAIPDEAMAVATVANSQSGAQTLSALKIKDVIVDADENEWLIQYIPERKQMDNVWNCICYMQG
jgi:hypothetical protein